MRKLYGGQTMSKKFKAIFLAVALLLGVAAPSLAQDSTLTKIQQRGVVRIGVLTGAPPMGMVDEQGRPSGYDVDVANLIGTYLGTPVELVPLTTTPRISALQSDKVDFLVATLAPTGERAKQVMFTTPYSAFSHVIMAKEKYSNLDDLAGKTVAVNRGSPSETALRNANVKDIKIILYEDDSTVAQALISGQADAVALPSTVAHGLLRQVPNSGFQIGVAFLKQGNSMTVRLGDFEMLQYLNTAIYLMKVSGELDAISMKWTDEPLVDLPSL